MKRVVTKRMVVDMQIAADTFSVIVTLACSHRILYTPLDPKSLKRWVELVDSFDSDDFVIALPCVTCPRDYSYA